MTLRDGAGQALAEYVVRPGAGPELSREYVYGNGRLMAIESACGPRPRLELASPAQQGTQVQFRKTDFVDPVGEYTLLIESEYGQRRTLERPASLADVFGIEQEEFFPGVTNRVTLQARAACGATGYSNAVSYGRDPGLPGCLEDMAVFYANLAPDGSGDLTPRSPSSGAGCPPGTSFNLYYRRPGIATVRLNAQALATPAFVIADQPAGAGHGEYWYVPLDPVTQQEGPAGPVVTSDARNSTAGPEGLPGQPSRNAQYVGWDHLGSTRLITDEQGVSLGGWKYYPFGIEAESSGPAENRKRFTGHERDTDTALDHMMARYYGPSLARFLSTDPGSAGVGTESPQTWNAYAYTNNNPIAMVDRDGESATVAGAPIGGAIGGGMALVQGKSWREVGAAAAGGAVAGAMMGSVIDTGGASLGVMVAAGALSGAAGGLVEDTINGQQTSAGDIALDSAAGAAGVMLGSAVGAATGRPGRGHREFVRDFRFQQVGRGNGFGSQQAGR